MIWASVWNFGLWVMLRSYVVMSISRQAPQDARSKVGPRHRLGSHKFTVTVDIFFENDTKNHQLEQRRTRAFLKNSVYKGGRLKNLRC